MSLTLGAIAPLRRPPGGTLNLTLPERPHNVLFLHPLAQRLRGELDGVTVVDTTRATMLHETGYLPKWYFPIDDVRSDLLEPSATSTHCPFKGDCRYWHLRIGGRVVEDAFWEYPEPLPGAPDLSGLLSPDMAKFDRFLEEDEELIGHPRDPFHRVDARRSSRRVTVRAAGQVVADSNRAVALFETGFPPRWYLPLEDIDHRFLVPSETVTVCPYKGVATYWSLRVGDRTWTDAVWTYADPLLEALPAKGCACILEEGIETEVQPAGQEG
jgi:uncharacterized protein (DUF427 family)